MTESAAQSTHMGSMAEMLCIKCCSEAATVKKHRQKKNRILWLEQRMNSHQNVQLHGHASHSHDRHMSRLQIRVCSEGATCKQQASHLKVQHQAKIWCEKTSDPRDSIQPLSQFACVSGFNASSQFGSHALERPCIWQVCDKRMFQPVPILAHNLMCCILPHALWSEIFRVSNVSSVTFQKVSTCTTPTVA